MDISSKRREQLHLIFMSEGNLLVMKNKKGLLGFPCVKIDTIDGYSSVCAGARVVIEKCNGVDLRKLSINKNYEKVVNWEAYD